MKPDTNDTIGLSRRKLLAGLGAVGVASAGAGLGTTAYFNDTETFEGNTLTAGELDLKLDYKSTYLGGPGRLDDVVDMGYPDAEDLGDGRYLLDQTPSPADMQAWEDLVMEDDFDFCSPEADEYLVNGDGIPVFTLDDVKPGDSGEVTISLHICDNPAYLYLAGEITENAENGQSEPEAAVDETGGDPGDGMGELADFIEVCVWYDEDCDNVYEPTGTGQQQELEVALVSDTSGSMSGSNLSALKTAATSFVGNLSSPDEAAAISFSSGTALDQELTTNYQSVQNAINNYTAGGQTNVAGGISVAEDELLTGTNATPGASKVMIVLTDGFENVGDARDAADDAKNAGIRIFGIGLGNSVDTDLVEDISSSPDDAFFAPDPADLDTVYAEIAQIVLEGEQKIASGTMSEVFGQLSEGVALDGNRQDEGRQPYPGATTQCIGFEWTLPAEVGNEIQTDSVAFDLAVYAEQSRHNDNPQVAFNGTEANSTSPGPAPNGTGNVSGSN
ncbi:VWA domain-containing protein [Halorubrum sp. BV1]|uniref:vWA domain-containing protein n=1 Tax=Halorubrum sp. BV1 TaxID=1498500 RepID=UPI0006787953|nr:VWA domain-containing protein [Halorubrum sp. BV1]